MNGKDLRRRHRAAMRKDGGLVRETDQQGNLIPGYIQTARYVPFRAWLRTADDDIQKAGLLFLNRKAAEKEKRRIIGPKDPHSPSKQRRARDEVRRQMGEVASAAKRKDNR